MTTHAEALLAATATALTPSTADLHAMSESFREEIARGLAGSGGSLKMLPTFVRQPRGDERGQVMFLDWGGTHGRAGSVVLGGDGRVEVEREEVFTFSDEDKAAPPDHVFDTMAAALERVTGRDRITPRPVGFAYSFPARLERIDRAIALSLTKGRRLQRLEGRDVVELLAQALPPRGGRAAARCPAVREDGRGTLPRGDRPAARHRSRVPLHIVPVVDGGGAALALRIRYGEPLPDRSGRLAGPGGDRAPPAGHGRRELGGRARGAEDARPPRRDALSPAGRRRPARHALAHGPPPGVPASRRRRREPVRRLSRLCQPGAAAIGGAGRVRAGGPHPPRVREGVDRPRRRRHRRRREQKPRALTDPVEKNTENSR